MLINSRKVTVLHESNDVAADNGYALLRWDRKAEAIAKYKLSPIHSLRKHPMKDENVLWPLLPYFV